MNAAVKGMAILLAGVLAAGADELVIQSFDTSGALTFNEVSNASAYRVEWAPAAGAAWTNSWESLNNIPATGSGIVTASVPLVFRVVATLVIGPTGPPPGMVFVPAGTFVMGATTNVGHESTADELPQHTLSIGGFHMDPREVTKAAWDDVATWALAHGYAFDNAGGGKDTNHPVQTVSWYDCVKWCNARSEREGRTPAYYTSAALTPADIYRTGQVSVATNWVRWDGGYRLPTEAEWERAARGGAADHRFSWTDSDEIQHARANYYSTDTYTYDTSPTRNSHPTYATGATPYTSPVGSFLPNGYGLYDMTGNVMEWCWDWYSTTYYGSSPTSDPPGPDTGTDRVYRGGSWAGSAVYCRVAKRVRRPPDGTADNLGFRTVWSGH